MTHTTETAEAVHRAALAGDQAAREAEENRIHGETKVIDMRGKVEGHRCYKTAVHDRHDYEDVVWSEPRWVNPRTVWLRDCIGVRDETPYPTIVNAGEQGVWIWRQDEASPLGGFAICRRLIVSRAPYGGVHLDTEIWRGPPREWPPVHMGSAGAGLRISDEQARQVRDWLNIYLEEQERGDGDEDG